jgi:hypothetical protein
MGAFDLERVNNPLIQNYISQVFKYSFSRLHLEWTVIISTIDQYVYMKLQENLSYASSTRFLDQIAKTESIEIPIVSDKIKFKSILFRNS